MSLKGQGLVLGAELCQGVISVHDDGGAPPEVEETGRKITNINQTVSRNPKEAFIPGWK